MEGCGGAGRDDSSLSAGFSPSQPLSEGPVSSRSSRAGSLPQGAWNTIPTTIPRAPSPAAAPPPLGMADVCAFLRGLSLLPAAGSSLPGLPLPSPGQLRAERGPRRVLGRLGGGRSCKKLCWDLPCLRG